MSTSSDPVDESQPTEDEVIPVKEEDDEPTGGDTTKEIISASSPDAPSINYSLPDSTPYTGRYYVNLPNVVDREWWKDSSNDTNNPVAVAQQPSWKPIGGFTGSVIAKEDIFEVEAYPSPSVPLIDVAPAISPFRFFTIKIESGNEVTTAKLFITIVGTAGTSEPLEWTTALIKNGESTQTFKVDITPENPDIGIVRSILVKKEAFTAAPDAEVILYAEALTDDQLTSEEKRKNVRTALPVGRGKYSVFKGEDDKDVEEIRFIDNQVKAALVPKGLTASFFDDPITANRANVSEAISSIIGFGVDNIPESSAGDFTSAFVIADSSSDTVDWSLTKIVVNNENFDFSNQKFPLKETQLSVEKKGAVDPVSLIRQFDNSVDTPGAFNQLKEDSLSFYSQPVTSTKFTISLDGFSVESEDGLVQPTFGLMVRESLEKGSLYFAILFVSEPQGGYTVRTIVRPQSSMKNSNPVESFQSISTGFQTLGSSSDLTSRTIKIIREDNDFAGYMDSTLIGKSDLSNLTNSLSSALQSRRTILGKVEGGIAVFSPLKYLFRGVPIENLSTSKVIFTKTQTVDVATVSTASEINKSFSLIEAINLSTFYGDYGAGRTIKTFTLLPSEETEISISSYKDSTETTTSSQTIFDSFTEESSREFENTVEQEQSNASQYENTRKAHVEASAGFSKFGAHVSFTAGASTSETSSRQEMARSVMSSVEKHAAKASSQRDVEINTSSERKVQVGRSKTVTRKLININKSRTLNFTFRQMNQEFISILHLVDLRISFVGGREGTYEEEDISNLREFVSTYVKNKFVDIVVNRIYKKIQYVEDYKENRREVLTMKTLDDTNGKWNKKGGVAVKENDLDEKQDINPPLKFQVPPVPTITVPVEETNTNEPMSFIAFDKDLKSTLVLGSGENKRRFPVDGVILAYDSNVVRTDGILTEAILGKGEGLDRYNNDLQQADIAQREVETAIKSARKDLLLLKKDILGNWSTISFQVFFASVCIAATIQLLYGETTPSWNYWIIGVSASIFISLLIFEYYASRTEKSDEKE